MSQNDASIKNGPQEASPKSPVDEGNGQTHLRNVMTTAAMSLLVLVLAYMILRELTAILQPLMFAVFICYLIVPVHHLLVRCKVPSIIAYVLIVGVFLGCIYTVANMAFGSVAQMSEALPEYVEQIQTRLDKAQTYLEERLRGWGSAISDRTSNNGAESTGTNTPATLPATEEPATSTVHPQWEFISAGQLLSFGQSVLEAFVGLSTATFVILIYLFFLLAEQASFGQRVANAFDQPRAQQIMAVIGKINTAISHYIVVKTLISALVAVLSTIILIFFGVKYAILWGVVAFFANFIPYVGSMVAVLLPIGMSVIQFASVGRPLAVAITLVITQQVIGTVLEPRLIGNKLGVSPLLILLSLTFWGMLWGIPGMILSAPLAVTIKIVLENIESTRPVGKLISNV